MNIGHNFKKTLSEASQLNKLLSKLEVKVKKPNGCRIFTAHVILLYTHWDPLQYYRVCAL